MTASLAGKKPFKRVGVGISWLSEELLTGAQKAGLGIHPGAVEQELSSKRAAVAMALNGNGPARLSAYSDPQLASLPYLNFQGRALVNGHITIASPTTPRRSTSSSRAT